jgi:hypothetical protein
MEFEDQPMPQPLSRVRKNAGIAFGPGFLNERPELVPYIGFIIEQSSYAELQFSNAFYKVLGTTARSGFSIIDALRGRRQTMNVLDSVVVTNFTAIHDQNLVKAVLACYESVAGRRDIVAHHLWGISSDLPDALLLIHPKLYHQTMSHVDDARRSGEVPKIESMRFDYARIMVYRKSDFERLLNSIKEVHAILYAFNGWLGKPADERDEQYQWLSSQPLVHERLAHMGQSS